MLMFQDQKRELDEERKSLHRAMQEEHKKILAAKTKMAVQKRLHLQGAELDDDKSENYEVKSNPQSFVNAISRTMEVILVANAINNLVFFFVCLNLIHYALYHNVTKAILPFSSD